jgi:hypothetical protein
MRGLEMARLVISKINLFFNYLTLSALIGGCFLIHIITAMTFKSYYGKAWGYTAFLLPGIAEFYLVILQVSEQMYNYTIIIAGFLTMTTAVGLTSIFKNSVKSKLARIKAN